MRDLWRRVSTPSRYEIVVVKMPLNEFHNETEFWPISSWQETSIIFKILNHDVGSGVHTNDFSCSLVLIVK
jgi:hypothetical protein